MGRQRCARTEWAIGTVSLSSEKVFGFLKRAAQWRVSVFKRQECANTAWAFATVSISSDMLSAAGARGAEAQGFVNTAWAFAAYATAGQRVSEVK